MKNEDVRVQTMVEIIREVYLKHDAFIVAKIAEYEFDYEYLVIEYTVLNTGFVILDAKFCNDILNHNLETLIYSLADLNQNFELLKRMYKREQSKLCSMPKG